jgi:excisionase family DNA binding protein
VCNEQYDVMTAGEVAAYLRLDQATVYRLAQAGEIPGRRVGRSWRFHRAVLNEWLETQMRENVERAGESEGVVPGRHSAQAAGASVHHALYRAPPDGRGRLARWMR